MGNLMLFDKDLLHMSTCKNILSTLGTSILATCFLFSFDFYRFNWKHATSIFLLLKTLRNIKNTTIDNFFKKYEI